MNQDQLSLREVTSEDRSLVYYQDELPYKASEVFWFALAVARWDGDAAVDFDTLTLVYSTPDARDRRGHDVTVACQATGRRKCLLSVHAHRRESLASFTLKSDRRKEREIAGRIASALEWSKTELQRRVAVDADYFDETMTLQLDFTPKDAILSVSDICVPSPGGFAEVRIKSGYHVAEIQHPDYFPESRGFYYATVQTLPSLAVFANVTAPPDVTRPLRLPRPTTPPPGRLVVPPTRVLPGAGRRLVGKAARKVVFKVVGKALVPIGVAADLYEIYKVGRVTWDIIRIDKDNDDFKRSCCCEWSRTDVITGPFELEQPGVAGQDFEYFKRRFRRTVLRPNAKAPCQCGVAPLIQPSLGKSVFIVPGQFFALPGGPVTAGPTSIPGVRCSSEGQLPAVNDGFRRRFFRRDD